SATGIAVKDSSTAEIQNSQFSNIAFDALMTYVKKPYFEGVTSLIAEGFSGDQVTSICSREIGTQLMIDSVNCVAKELNVKELYKGRMKK
ncbi:MAG: hypothetical protein VW270_28650, partial [Candidatus Poseidoniales archaeon]